ncbi:MAG: leucine-rich repeat protein [Clostridia bacterium]|nr:leucine-rich repeat protein [Clostridia bacterium]
MKNSIKKAISLILCLLLISGSVAAGREGLTSLIDTLGIRASAAGNAALTYNMVDGRATLTSCDNSISGELSIPLVVFQGEYVTAIGDSAFSGCTGLTGIIIPSVFTDMGDSVFSGCTGLKNVTIGKNVSSIGDSVFGGCSALESIDVSSENTVYRSAGNCLIETDRKKLIAGCKSSVIPDDGSVTGIGSGAFSGCSGLKSITVPDSVTSIGAEAFSNCTGLGSFTIPAGVTNLEAGVFSGCSGLKNITIPDTITALPDELLYGCKSLEKITVQNTVTKIGNGTFGGCQSLSEIVIPGSVSSIGSSAFSGCTGLKAMTVPEGVNTLESDLFKNCTSLSDVKIPGSVTAINSGVFDGCTALKDVYYNGTVQEWNSINKDGTVNSALSAVHIHYMNEPYTATFMVDGTIVGTDVYTMNSPRVTEPAIPEKTGYSASWGNYSLAEGGTVINAVYSAKGYTLTVNYVMSDGNNSAKPNNANKSIKYNSSYSIPTPAVIGYTPDIISVDGVMDSEGKTATVTYYPNEYSLTIYYLYEDGNMAREPHAENIDYGKEYSIESPEIYGYICDMKAVSGKKGAEAENITVTYTPEQHTMTLVYPGSEDEYYYRYGETVATPADPETEGYTFNGWDRVFPITMPAEDIVVNAIVTVNQYKIIYKLDGIDQGTDTVAYSQAVPVREKPTKGGYVISPWHFTPALEDGKMPASDVVAEAVSMLVFDFVKDRWNSYNIYDSIGRDYYQKLYGPSKGFKLREAREEAGADLSDTEFVGHCFGLALSTAIFDKNKELINKYGESELVKVVINPKDRDVNPAGQVFSGSEDYINILDFVKYCHVYQYSYEYVNTEITVETKTVGDFTKNTVSDLFEAVNAFQNEEGSPVIISFIPNDSNSTGHAVFVSGLVGGTFDDGRFDIGINDSEYKDMPNLVIRFIRQTDGDAWDWQYGELIEDGTLQGISRSGNTGTEGECEIRFHKLETATEKADGTEEIINDYDKLNAAYSGSGNSNSEARHNEMLSRGYNLIKANAQLMADIIDYLIKICFFDGEGDAPDLYWAEDLTELNFENTTGEKSEFSVTGTAYSVESTLEPDASATVTVDGENSLSTIDFSNANDISISYSYYDDEGKEKEVEISGKSTIGDVSAQNKESDTVVTGLDSFAVELKEDDKVISSVSRDVMGGATDNAVVVTVTDENKIIIKETNFAVSVIGYNPQSEINYRTSVIYHCLHSALPNGVTAHWFLDDEDCGASETLTVPEARDGYTIQVKLLDPEGNVMAESETETVKVRNRFFDKLVWFIRHLFNPAAYRIDRKE